MSFLHARDVMDDDQCIIGMRGAAVGCRCRARVHMRVAK
jgi:hypothetical protein